MSDDLSREELKKIESEMESLLTQMRKEVIHKLSNTDKDHLTDSQFKSAVSSARQVGEKWEKLIKQFRHLINK